MLLLSSTGIRHLLAGATCEGSFSEVNLRVPLFFPLKRAAGPAAFFMLMLYPILHCVPPDRRAGRHSYDGLNASSTWCKRYEDKKANKRAPDE